MTSNKKKWLGLIWTAVALIFALVVSAESAVPAVRIKVNSFKNLTGDSARSELAEALRESVLLGLIHIHGLIVVPLDADASEAEWVISGALGTPSSAPDSLEVKLSFHPAGKAVVTTDTLRSSDANALLLAELPGVAATFAKRAGVALIPTALERIEELQLVLDTEEDAVGVFYRVSADSYRRLGMYRKEGDLILKAASRIGEPETPDAARYLVSAAIAFREADDHDRALDLLQSAARIHRQHMMVLEMAEDDAHKGKIYASMAEQKKAERAFAGAKKRLKKLLTEERAPETEYMLSLVLNYTGDLAAAAGKGRKALGIYQEALEIQERLDLGPRAAETMRDLGAVRLDMGEISEALELYDQAIAIQTEYDVQEELAGTWMAVADARLVLGEYDRAMAALRNTRDIFMRIGWDRELAKTLVRMGDIYALQEDPDRAIPLYDGARMIQRQLGLTREMAKTDVLAGNMHVLRGVYSRAMGLYQSAKVVQVRLSLQHDLLRTYRAMAYALRLQESYLEAKELYRKAEKVAKKLKLRSELAEIYSGLGGLYVATGRPHWALGYLRRAAQTWESLGRHKERTIVLNHVGVVYESTDDAEAARKRYREALAIARDIGFGLGVALVSENLGMLIARTDRPDDGLRLLEEARDFRQGANMHSGLARVTYPRLATVLKRMGRHKEAIEYYRKVNVIADSLRLAEEAISAWFNLGQLYRNTGEYDASLQALQEADSRIDASVSRMKREDIQEQIGVTYMSKGMWTEAINTFDNARDGWTHRIEKEEAGRSLLPGEVSVAQLWERRGVALAMDGRWAEAIPSYRHARSLLEKVRKASRSTGYRTDGVSRPTLLEDVPEYLPELLPDRIARVDNLLGVARYHAGDWDKGENGPHVEDVFVKVRKTWGHGHWPAVALNNLGVAMYARGSHDEALNALNKGIRMVAGSHPVDVYHAGVVAVPNVEAVREARPAVHLLLNMGSVLERQAALSRAIPRRTAHRLGGERTPIAEAVDAVYATALMVAEGMEPWPLTWQAHVLSIEGGTPNARIRRIRHLPTP